MKYFALGLLIFMSTAVWAPQFLLSSARPAITSISPTDPDFSIVLFPDTELLRPEVEELDQCSIVTCLAGSLFMHFPVLRRPLRSPIYRLVGPVQTANLEPDESSEISRTGTIRPGVCA